MPTLAHEITLWEDVADRLRRASVSWHGNSLSERDLCTFTEAIVMCAIHLTDLSLRYGGIGAKREIVAWATQVVTLDVHDLGSFLSDAVGLLRTIEQPTTYNWFKRQLREKYPFVGMYLAPIRRAMSSFLEDPNPRDFYVCYQFLSFLTHLTLLDINVELEEEYEELERYLQSLSYPSTIVTEMNSIMREWMKDFSISEENFMPSHGPGAIAELSATAAKLTKYHYLGSDALIDYVFSKHAGIDVTTYFPRPKAEWKRESKVVFVPKSMKTRRTISKEPATLMYLQQGVSRILVDYIHDHPTLSRHIDLRRQELNADLAISSSADHRYATIDLSSASDTVTTELVKAVFRGTPVYPYLVALRSSTVVLPSGKVLSTAKYAPMGSALCFPIESLIFACAVEFTVRRAQRTHLGYFPDWRVYGDDIIVRDPLFWDTTLTLETLGFMLNASKSFSSPMRFRESCGGEGYDGVNVTPLKISRGFRTVRGGITSCHAAEYQGLVDLANQCYVYGLPLLRTWIVRVLLSNPVAPPLFSWEGNGALYSVCPDNYRAKRRIHNKSARSSDRTDYCDFQRLEIQVAMVENLPLRKKQQEDLLALEQDRYFETLRLISKRSGDMFQPEHRCSVPSGTGDSRIRKVWVEIP